MLRLHGSLVIPSFRFHVLAELESYLLIILSPAQI
jgi:hypothetical protein